MAPRPLPLEAEAIQTEERSRGTTPMELTASMARRMPRSAQRAARAGRSVRWPVLVSQWVVQSQRTSGWRSRSAASLGTSRGLPHGRRRCSWGSQRRRA